MQRFASSQLLSDDICRKLVLPFPWPIIFGDRVRIILVSYFAFDFDLSRRDFPV